MVGPSPVTMFTTPGGKTCWARSTSVHAASGASSAGFTMTVHPAANAGASFHSTSATGKFHGVIAATTPTGSGRTVLPLVNDAAGRWRFHEPPGLAGEVVDDVDRPRDLGLGFGEGLADLVRDEARDLCGVRVEEACVASEVVGPLERSRDAPSREGAVCRRRGTVDRGGVTGRRSHR